MPEANTFNNISSPNILLQQMDAQKREALSAHSTMVELRAGEIVQKRGQRVERLLFPLDCVLSQRVNGAQGQSIETAQIGREGAVGLELVVAGEKAVCDVQVLSPGLALQMPAPDRQSGTLLTDTFGTMLCRYALSLLDQNAQTVMSVARLSLEARLARWLLMHHDRIDGDDLRITHEGIARLLGVRRPGVTLAMHALEGEGLVRSLRGLCRIANRSGLERLAGDAYGVAETLYADLIGQSFSKSVASPAG